MAFLKTTKRDELVREYLAKHGIFDLFEAPDEFVNAAHEYADGVLGKGKVN